GDAFPATKIRAVLDCGHHHDRLVLGAPRDGEPPRNRPAFDGDLQMPRRADDVNHGRFRLAAYRLPFSWIFLQNQLVPRGNQALPIRAMLNRTLTLNSPTQARAPGFRVELHGTTFRLIASGAWTVAEATQIDAA